MVSLETFASYAILGVRYLLSKRHLSLALQLHRKYSLLGFKTCLLCDDMTDSMFFIQQLLIFAILQLNNLCIGCHFGKWCSKSFRNVLPTCVFTFMKVGDTFCVYVFPFSFIQSLFFVFCVWHYGKEMLSYSQCCKASL